MGGSESTNRRLNKADETENDDRESRTNEAGSSGTRLAVAAGAAILVGVGCVAALVSASGASSESEKETMKAPGRKNDRIYGDDFESDPTSSYVVTEGNCLRTSPSKNIHWRPPMHGFVKLNTDGATNVKRGISGAGGILRDSAGNWIVGFIAHLGICSIIDAELQAVKLGLIMAWEEGYRRIVCEMDSMEALELIKSEDVRFHRLRVLILDIRELRDRNWECSFQHTFREGNFCADILSKQGLISMDNGCELLRSPPVEVVDALQADAKGVAYPRGFRLT